MYPTSRRSFSHSGFSLSRLAKHPVASVRLRRGIASLLSHLIEGFSSKNRFFCIPSKKMGPFKNGKTHFQERGNSIGKTILFQMHQVGNTFSQASSGIDSLLY